MKAGGELCRGGAVVGENEHADAPRLAPANGLESDRLRPGGDGVPQSAHDRSDLAGGPAAEKRERDMIPKKAPISIIPSRPMFTTPERSENIPPMAAKMSGVA